MSTQLVAVHNPGLKWWLKHLENGFDPANSVDLYVGALKRRVIRNPTPAAVGTAQLFLRLISAYRFQSIRQLVDYVSSVEQRLSAARPREMSVRNMARRVIGIIREEAENNGMGDLFQEALQSGISEKARQLSEALQPQQPSVRNLSKRPTLLTQSSFAVGGALTSIFEIISHPSSSITSPVDSTPSPPQTGTVRPAQSQSIQHVRPAIIQDIQELIEELDSSENNIAEFAMQVIHNKDVIMTYGLPSTVKRLLLRAAQKREFTVIVVEGSLNIYQKTHTAVMNKDALDGLEEEAAARKALQERGFEVIVISDSDVWNFMGRVNKVLLGTEYVFADGGLLAPAGTKNIVRAAKTKNTAVVVVTGSHKLCPITTFFEDQWIEMGDPKTIDFQEGYLVENVEFPNPIIDFIPAKYVGSFVTNNGILAPNAIYRATLDLYHMTECDLL